MPSAVFADTAPLLVDLPVTMSLGASLLTRLREFFLLEQAESTLVAYTPAQLERVRECAEAAACRVDAARRVGHAVPACELLREAVLFLLWAKALARDPSCEAPTPGDLVRFLPDLPALPRETPGLSADGQWVRGALSSDDRLWLDRLSPQDAEATRAALERMVGFLRRRVEARSLTYVRWARRGRLAASSIVAMVLSYRIVASFVAPWNVALDKPVIPSSFKVNPPDGHELVDGSFPYSYAVQTDREESPHIVIDLKDVFRIRTVKVYNRGDGWQDEGLPIAAELSVDGEYYYPIGRRETHFDRDPPWVIRVPKLPARYVRLRGERSQSYLALSQVEVFGKK